MKKNDTTRRIRLGMVGGGEGAFIGAVHRIAARLDDHYEFVAGALSSTADKARRSGQALGLAPDRIYSDYAADGAGRSRAHRRHRSGGHRHAEPPARAGGRGVPESRHPRDLRQAGDDHQQGREASCSKLATQRELLFARHAQLHRLPDGAPRAADGARRQARRDPRRAGRVPAGLARPSALEASGQKQAAWRTDPARSGAGGAIGDIGTHAHNLAAYVTGLELVELCADLSTFVKGRALDDNAQVMLRYANGARGVLWASQVAPGNENNLRIRVYGSKGGLEWRQEHPNHLHWSPFGQPTQVITRGTGAANAARRAGQPHSRRAPGGLPRSVSPRCTRRSRRRSGPRASSGPKADKAAHFPTLDDGIKGVAFIEAVVASSARGGRWVKLSA